MVSKDAIEKIAEIDRMLSNIKLEEMDRRALKEERKRFYEKRGRASLG